MTQTLQPAAETNRTFEDPRLIHLILAYEVFHDGPSDAPCSMTLQLKSQEQFGFAAHRIVGATRPDGGVKADSRLENTGANRHVGPVHQV
jgi:hypothetical protein